MILTTEKFNLFIFGCIFVRSIFVIIAKNNYQYLPLMGKLAFIPVIGFIYNLKKNGNGFFGGKIWWSNLRPIHALLYSTFAILALKKRYPSLKQ